MTDYQAELLAAEVAAQAQHRPSYYTEPFKAHDWVIAAILTAAERAYQEGYADGHTDAEASEENAYDEGYAAGQDDCDCVDNR